MVSRVPEEHGFLPERWYFALAAAILLALGLLDLAGALALPIGAWFTTQGGLSMLSSSSIVSTLTAYGYVSLFILMAVESASLPVPSEVVLPFAGYLVYVGAMDFTLALVDSTIAGVVGALVVYYLALKLGRGVMDRILGKFGVKATTIDRAERWMSRQGAWGVLAARFVPGLRSVISVPAGLFNMDVRPFFVTTLVGSFVWSAFLIYLGYSAGRLWGNAVGASSAWVGTAVALALIICAASYLGWYAYGLRRKPAPA
jgi:membrane protein DedA with SNARE-associated domain